MILPLADALQNCLQNLTSRIAGVDNEQMTGRVMGMGAMLGFGLGAIKEQFKTPTTKTTNTTTYGNSNNDDSQSGLKGFVSRAKSIINPTMNLSDEKDYNGNTNPIRDVISNNKANINQNTVRQSNNITKQSNIENKTSTSLAKSVAKTGFNATKTYLDIGAKMAEGNFNKPAYTYNGLKNNKQKNNFQNTEYINRIANNFNDTQKLGDDNDFNKQS